MVAPSSLRRPLPLVLLAALPGLAAPAAPQETAPGATPGPTQTDDDAAPAQAPERPPGGADPSKDAFELGSPPQLPEGMSEEEMWPAATAEGWRKPCLVRWQRTFDDALAVARAQRRPLLVAVNMDGEIASEHFAGVRYREPATAALLEPYVCVVASVYRHTPRDHDENGLRVECPRFGTVTCGEHVEAERELYDQYFDGRRVAPRHIVIDLEGKETLDVYYSWDTATVFTTFRAGVQGWPEPVEPVERTLIDLVESTHVEDRETIERAYREGDRELRRRLLLALNEARAVDQVEVLRAAVFGFDVELASLARRALARCETEGALDLMAEALKVPLEPAERQLLLDAVARLSQTSRRARTLAAVHSGLSRGSRHIDAAAVEARAREYEASAGRGLDVQARAEAAASRPREPGVLLELAEALVARALETPERRYAELMLADALEAAEEARAAGASGPRLDGVLAVVADARGDVDAARRHAVAAIESGLLRVGDDLAGALGGASGSAVALDGAARTRLLRLFAEARQRAIRDAYRAGESWPPEWLSDVNAAYASITDDALGGPEPLVGYHDFLRWIGATPRADAVLDDALRRFPDAPELHARLRGHLLWEGGAEGLEQDYAERLAREAAEGGEPTQLAWFAGYASLVAAEHHRRHGRLDEALAAYDRGIGHYRRNIEQFPEGADTSRHFVALAHAGRARVALERGELATAADDLLASLELRPDSAATQDGLGLTPLQTARMLRARLVEAGEAERAARVQAAIDALDPALLEPPPSELPGGRPPRGPGRGRPGGGRGR